MEQRDLYRMGKWLAVLMLGCSSSPPNSSTESCLVREEAAIRWPQAAPSCSDPDRGQITEKDQATWIAKCNRPILVPSDGSHPPNCGLSPACAKPDKTGHLGGKARHDWCADTQPPNRFWRRAEGFPAGSGCDVRIGDRSKPIPDAATKEEDNEVWEVKVHDYACAPLFLKDIWWKEIMEAACETAPVALECGYKFVLGIADQDLFWRLVSTVQSHPDFKDSPALRLMEIRSLQACRPSSAFTFDPDPEAPACAASGEK